MKHMNFVQTAEFSSWLPWQRKGLICETNIQKSSPQEP